MNWPAIRVDLRYAETPRQCTAARVIVLAVLAARGIELTAEQKRRVQRSTSQANLDNWLRQAATAHSADEVFA